MTNHIQTVQRVPEGICENIGFASAFVKWIYRLFFEPV